MKVASLSVLPPVRTRTNRRRKAFEGINSTNPNVEVSKMPKNAINILA